MTRAAGDPLRIAIAAASGRRVGGAEVYVERISRELVERRHVLAFWCESAGPSERAPIALPPATHRIDGSRAGGDAWEELRTWRPDVIFSQGLRDPERDRRLSALAPSILFLHGYAGMCISGAKSHRLPALVPCRRRFGPPCLALYYPRRCGGLDPRTMLRDYRREARRLDLWRHHQAIVSHSGYLCAEAIRHGVAPERVHFLPPWIEAPTPTSVEENPDAAAPGPWRLAFIGRMERLKGGALLLRVLPEIARRLGGPIELVLAGDGTARSAWERRAARILRDERSVDIRFTGWLGDAAKDDLLRRTHLLIVPSGWPEPLGLVGLEAARHGVPSVAFDAGGIPGWLEPGENGFLASADPPRPRGLAQAVIACLQDPRTYAALRRGARRKAERFGVSAHLDALLAVFDAIARGGKAPATGRR